MSPKVAAITMVYNESALLPIWAKHYSRQVGADYCFVIDHGSTDQVIVSPGVNVLRLPRSPHDDRLRARFVTDLASTLLHYFDWVIYTDVDEIIIADPDFYRDLPALCGATTSETLSCVGLDVQHIPSLETDLDTRHPIGSQRGWARFTGAMCKPLLTRQARVWSPGFHSADTPTVFGPVYLFHLHWADRRLGLERLLKTREMPWGDTRFGLHQRLADRTWIEMFDSMSALPRIADVNLALQTPPLTSWLDRFRFNSVPRDGRETIVPVDLNAPELWEIPERFRKLL